MPLFRQVQNQAGEWELIEIEDRPRGLPRLTIMGAKARDSYRSPIDGAIITSQRAEREHMRVHGVVRPGDFGANEGREYYARKAEERAQVKAGTHPSVVKERKQDILQAIQKVEQGYKPTIHPGE